MPLKFQPNFTITPKIASVLMQIEGVKQTIKDLPITPAVVTKLRETARLVSTHYSTMIEGNRLTQEQVERVLKTDEHFPSRERDEHEVKGYYSALSELEHLVAKRSPISESVIQKLHALVMGKGKTRVKPSLYREGQNVIRDAGTGKIVYMPPEAKDVPRLIKGLVDWIKRSQELPNPILAGISHYQFATIHPYYDGNGRTARLLTTLILHLGGYDLKGLYSLEEYYAQDLKGYYEAISIGPSHNYYMGRAEADITSWIGYFCEGMAHSFEKVRDQAKEAALVGEVDLSSILRKLDPRQRKVLELFQKYEIVTAKQIGELFGFKPRTSRELCRKWVEAGFIAPVDLSRRARKYQLSKQYLKLL